MEESCLRYGETISTVFIDAPLDPTVSERSANAAGKCTSMRSTCSGGALPPASDFTLKPFHSGGLWLAVIITPDAPLICVTA